MGSCNVGKNEWKKSDFEVEKKVVNGKVVKGNGNKAKAKPKKK